MSCFITSSPFSFSKVILNLPATPFFSKARAFFTLPTSNTCLITKKCSVVRASSLSFSCHLPSVSQSQPQIYLPITLTGYTDCSHEASCVQLHQQEWHLCIHQYFILMDSKISQPVAQFSWQQNGEDLPWYSTNFPSCFHSFPGTLFVLKL